MDARARRIALREYLTQARAALDHGAREEALRAVEAALSLDPEFLAAQSLRDEIQRGSTVTVPRLPASTPLAAPPALPDAASTRAPSPVQPIVSAEGWARFEHRARMRRVDRRADAARVAIARRRFDEATDAIEEIRAIDATHPEIISLGIELDAARQPATTRRWFRPGRALVAALAFTVIYLGPRWTAPEFVDRSLLSGVEFVRDLAEFAPGGAPPGGAQVNQSPSPETSGAELVPGPEVGVPAPAERAPAEPAPALNAAAYAGGRAFDGGVRGLAESRPVVPAAPALPVDEDAPRRRWADVRAPGPDPVPAFQPTAPIPTDPIAVQGVDPVASAGLPVATAGFVAPGAIATAPPTDVTRGVAPIAEPTRAPVVEEPRPVAALAPTAAVIPAARDEELVRRVLQHYRLAYEALDARSAQSVWPAVNTAQLQRAFDSLSSQQLTFTNCTVDVRGAAGTATCRGSARYVPKVGSSAPREEPRVWTFSLRKAGDDWHIENARAGR